MICQKITKMPMICNIPNRLVAIRVGPIWTMREWGTQCYHPRRTLEGSMGVKRTLVSLRRPVATPTTAPPVFDCDPGTYHCEPCLIQLWKLSLKINASPCTIWKTWILLLSEREEKKKHLFYSQWSEVLCYPTRGQTANEVSGPSLLQADNPVLSRRVRASVNKI